MKILALDFDGVIVDSILDSLFVSHNAYLNLYGSKSTNSFGGKLFTFENWERIKIEYREEINYYRKFRPFIRGATDYGIINKLMEEKKHIANQEEFDRYRTSVEFDFEGYHKAFYNERERLQNINYRSWYNLEPPYLEIIKGIKELLEDGIKIVVATSNRRKAIMRSFTPEYFGFFIAPEDILDKRFGEDKSEQMKYILNKFQVEFKDIYFVDDLVNHLISVKSLGVNVFLAGWSYATKEQKEKACLLKIPIIEKEEKFLPTLKKMLY